ncbi:LytR/AlgR family response regulator transcription factor [Spirosoma spitsbergense]|uniref:LytR/AlgR family response regulator transcription factor n=1 Tax=Spirosoma spitsbergense TaxID=431554 RepID=UPI00037612D5|nr:LytTR family DNA-binding domain-containing protein [Spirosoma spitsbergense]
MTAIIIDDEPDNVALLALQLARHCPQVAVIGQFTDSPSALVALRTQRPSLIFLDIEMPMLNGFQLLEQLGEVSFQVVFVTAYNQYAVRAFQFAALDYLLKPVDTIDLVNTIRRAETVSFSPSGVVGTAQLDVLKSWYPATAPGGAPSAVLPAKIALPHANGLTFIDINQILYAESDSNYTSFVLESGEKYLVSKTLGDVQDMLEVRNFLRVHRQYVVNLDHIKRLVRGEGTYLVLTNGVSIPVSRQQKDRLLERFGWV